MRRVDLADATAGALVDHRYLVEMDRTVRVRENVIPEIGHILESADRGDRGDTEKIAAREPVRVEESLRRSRHIQPAVQPDEREPRVRTAFPRTVAHLTPGFPRLSGI